MKLKLLTTFSTACLILSTACSGGGNEDIANVTFSEGLSSDGKSIAEKFINTVILGGQISDIDIPDESDLNGDGVPNNEFGLGSLSTIKNLHKSITMSKETIVERLSMDFCLLEPLAPLKQDLRSMMYCADLSGVRSFNEALGSPDSGITINGDITVSAQSPQTYYASINGKLTLNFSNASFRINNEKGLQFNGKATGTVTGTVEPNLEYPTSGESTQDFTSDESIAITGDLTGSIKPNARMHTKESVNNTQVEETTTCSGTITVIINEETQTCGLSEDCSGCKENEDS